MIALPRTYNAAADFVDRNLTEGRAEKTALRFAGRAYSYREIGKLVNRAGNALKTLGVEMENRVALLLRDSPEFVAGFFGAIKIGAVPVPLNTLLRATDYEYLLNDSRARVIIAHADQWHGLAEIRDRFIHLRHVVLVDGEESREPGFDHCMASAGEDLLPARTSKDDAAFWLYTSGSTGFPKAAVHRQGDMACCADLYAQGLLAIGPDDVVLSAAKLFFAYGLGNSMYFPFRVGASAILFPDRPRPESMFELIGRERPTLFFAVPTLYAAMLALPDTAVNRDLSSLRLCVSAGEPLPAELFRRWKERFGLEILDGIGTTEALHIFISNRPGHVRPGSSGNVVPGYEARIVDDRGAQVEIGEIGNLMMKGDSTFAYYWNQRDKTRQTVHGEWIFTGDKYRLDVEGYYWYCGRSDDMMKVGGNWVSPIEVENTLLCHPAVLEAAVVGREDGDGLTKPRAFIVLKEAYSPDPALEQELKTFVRDKLAPYKYPRWISFLSELPKTATGKIQRFRLRQL